MTQVRDIERLLDAWLAEGPSRISDRAFANAVDELRGAQQQPVWRLRWRDFNVSMPVRLAAVGIAAVVVVAIGLAITGPRNPGVGGSSASPTVLPSISPSPSASASPSPAAPSPTTQGAFGALAPGTYTATTPLVPFSFTVPAGWENQFNVLGSFMLRRESDVNADAIYVWPDVHVARQTICARAVEEGVGATVDDLVAFLTSHPDLEATTPTTIAVGGLTGRALEVGLAPDGSPYCNGRVSLFVHHDTITDAMWWDLGGEERMHLAILDAGDGHTVMINVQTTKAADFEDLVTAATPIVESFDFTP